MLTDLTLWREPQLQQVPECSGMWQSSCYLQETLVCSGPLRALTGERVCADVSTLLTHIHRPLETGLCVPHVFSGVHYFVNAPFLREGPTKTSSFPTSCRSARQRTCKPTLGTSTGAKLVFLLGGGDKRPSLLGSKLSNTASD